MPNMAKASEAGGRRTSEVRRIGTSLRTVIVGLGLGLSFQAFPSIAQTPGQPPDTMAARVEACTPCHGDKGRGTSDVYFPRLAGKPAGYLYNQLVAFKNGRRKYPPMNYLLEFLTDPYLQDMADYFASQHPELPAPELTNVSQQVLAQENLSSLAAMPLARSRPAEAAMDRRSPAWSPEFRDCSVCVRITSARSSAHFATVPGRPRRPTACRPLPPA